MRATGTAIIVVAAVWAVTRWANIDLSPWAWGVLGSTVVVGIGCDIAVSIEKRRATR